jgi:hypothetical protein
MRELGQLDAVLLTDQTLVMPTFFDMVDLYRLVTSRCHDELTFVVVVEGQHMRLWAVVLDVIAAE